MIINVFVTDQVHKLFTIYTNLRLFTACLF